MSAVPSTCRATVASLTEMFEAALGGDEVALAEAHLAVCPRCREVREGLRAVPAAVGDLTRVPVPADLSARILAAIAGPPAPPR